MDIITVTLKEEKIYKLMNMNISILQKNFKKHETYYLHRQKWRDIFPQYV